MSSQYDVVVLVGSLRKESLNRKVAKALMGFAPESLKLRFVEIGDLPLYNADLDDAPPEQWTRFRDEVRGADAVLFVTPEFNRSVPASLKNALDVGSRPPIKSVWKSKPAAIATITPGAMGGFGANHHLRQVLVPLHMPAMAAPEVYLGGAAQWLNAAGEITSESHKKVLQGFIEAFAKWTAALAEKKAA